MFATQQWLRIRSHRNYWRLLEVLVLGVLMLVGFGAIGQPVSAQTQPASAAGIELPSAYGTAPQSTCEPVWRLASTQDPDGDFDYLYGVDAVSANDVWAVGYYEGYVNEGYVQQALVERSNGSSWRVVDSPTANSYLYGVAAVSANDVWAVGSYYNEDMPQTLVEHWNGSTWSVVPSPNPGSSNELRGVAAVSANDVWVVGSYYNATIFTQQTLVEHWDGSTWSVVFSPNPAINDAEFSAVAGASANDVWAVGSYNDIISGARLTLVEHWNGLVWSIVSSPNRNAGVHRLRGVAAVSANDVWAVGGYASSIFGYGHTLVEHWDGSTWSIVDSPSGSEDFFKGVAAVSANDVWAVGSYFDTNTYIYQTLVQHWDGSSWSVVDSPNGGSYDNYLYGVTAVSATDVWVVGSVYHLHGYDGGASPLVIHYYRNQCR